MFAYYFFGLARNFRLLLEVGVSSCIKFSQEVREVYGKEDMYPKVAVGLAGRAPRLAGEREARGASAVNVGISKL